MAQTAKVAPHVEVATATRERHEDDHPSMKENPNEWYGSPPALYRQLALPRMNLSEGDGRNTCFCQAECDSDCTSRPWSQATR